MACAFIFHAALILSAISALPAQLSTLSPPRQLAANGVPVLGRYPVLARQRWPTTQITWSTDSARPGASAIHSAGWEAARVNSASSRALRSARTTR